MIKYWFDFLYLASYIIPGKERHKNFVKNTLYDYKEKLNVLKKALKDLDFKKVRMIKGGWNIGFIIDDVTVIKIRKQYDSTTAEAKILREKRITDALRPGISLAIPEIKIKETPEYVFYGYKFIPGVNMNTFSARTIKKHAKEWGKQIGLFISELRNQNPKEIQDLAKNTEGIIEPGWNHNDICNNVIVNPKTMKIVGIIDWEYAGTGALETEFNNTVAYKSKIKNSGILEYIKESFYKNIKK